MPASEPNAGMTRVHLAEAIRTPQDLQARIQQVKDERAKGFYVDAQEMEIQLYRDIADYANSTVAVAHILRLAVRELSQ